ncbi:phospholipase D family protein [Kingella denitrificans]|jgi:hypothetical protein|uniref:phospholipase D family protein n=1 Tax=Kingella denitrificans TaxID=502 RepID=UPI0028D7D45C|nr:phospholipase D family protein [Kingella denitrificans]
MELVTDTKKLSKTFINLTKKYRYISFATAWASTGHEAFRLLLEYQEKIQHSTIGLHFYQTDPEVLAQLQHNKNVRFISQMDGVFHPKLYLFWNTPTDWALLSGSANFTNGAFNGKNQETMLLTKGESADFFQEISRFLKNDCFDNAVEIGDEQIEHYRTLYHQRQKHIHTLSNYYPTGNKHSEMGKSILSTNILTYSWDKYFKIIQQDKNQLFKDRLDLLDYVKEFFQNNANFLSIDSENRKLISGLPNNAKGSQELDYGLFGSTKSDRKFYKKINTGNPKIAQAIDLIPLIGEVIKHDFLEYNRIFQQAGYKNPIGVATRLLTMKRPDLFFCFNGANKEKICAELGLPKNLNAERYWDEILLRIYDTAWFNSSRPQDTIEQKAWDGRVALIDCIYYEPKKN